MIIFNQKARMSTETERINAEIEVIHVKNIELAQGRKYSEIQQNLSKIVSLEYKRSQINKVNELKELMNFLNRELRGVDIHNPIWEHREHMCFHGNLGEAISTTSIDRKVFKAMFEAIVELNNKIEALK
jgi:hypothetical protein